MEENTLEYDVASDWEIEINKAIELYGHQLLRYCHNILCDYVDAQDAVQETFIKAYYKRNQFKENTSLTSWLYRIAYTTCMDMFRSRKLRDFLPLKQQAHMIEDNQEYMSEELKAALMSLSAKDRALIFSRVIDEKSYEELEQIYNASSSALRKRYERAKKKLADILRESNVNYLEQEERNE